MMNFNEKTILNNPKVTTKTDFTSEQIKEKKQVKKPKKLSEKTFFGISFLSIFLWAFSAVFLSSWIGYILILDPNSVLWINNFLPKNWQIPIALQSAPQTLEIIKKQATNENLIVGDTIPLGEEILIPFYQILKSCTEHCQVIVEIRIYSPIYVNNQELKYSLIDIITIGELNGAFSDRFSDFSENLKLTKIELLENSPDLGGLWFNLLGETQDQSKIYGEILYYDPAQKNLSLILPWQSQAKEMPKWKEITGKKNPELLINQSQLFKPLFEVYQLKINPNYNKYELENDRKNSYLLLEEISLKEPAIILPEYEKIMPQIEAKLWNLALQNLNALAKEIHPSIWTETADQQRDIIAFHGKLAEQECSQQQDTIENQIAACLFNSNGAVALEYFEPILKSKKKRRLTLILNWLKEDNFNLQKYLETAIKLNQFNEDLKIWQGVIIYSKQGKDQAMKWIKSVDNTNQETVNKLTEIFKEIDLTLTENINYKGHNSRIIGTGIPLKNIELYQWQNPNSSTPLKPIKPPQKWYMIDVNSFFDGQEWNHFPFEYINIKQYSNDLLNLWKMLGLDLNSQLTIITKKPQGREEITLTNIKGIRINNDKIQLLGVGIPVDENQTITPQTLPLAYSESAFNNIEFGEITLLELYQIQPELINNFLPKLWQVLPKQIKDNNVKNTEDMLTKIGHWKVKTTDLTGNNQPEGMLTLYSDDQGNMDNIALVKNQKKTASEISQHQIIFNEKGDIIYNELKENSGEFLMTIVGLEKNKNPVLLIDNGEGKYQMKIWSSSQQKLINFN